MCMAVDPTRRPSDMERVSEILESASSETKPIIDKLAEALENHAKNLDGRLKEELQKSKGLLRQIFPSAVAKKLEGNVLVPPEQFQSVSIFFSDIVGFTTISSKLSASQVVEFLDEMYTLFDDISSKFDVYKVETIGDAYMLASGVPNRNGDRHSIEICKCAMALLTAMALKKFPHVDEDVMIRAGVHTGSIVAAIVGKKMPRYTLVGDTVNTANRMESNSERGKLHISKSTKMALDQAGAVYTCTERGTMQIKGKGEMETFFVDTIE